MDTIDKAVMKQCPRINRGHFHRLGQRLREEARRGAIVLVGVVEVVGVELQLVVVEVEDRCLHELVVRVRTIAPTHSHHRSSRFSAQREPSISSHS
jgi:hypothetical protein